MPHPVFAILSSDGGINGDDFAPFVSSVASQAGKVSYHMRGSLMQEASSVCDPVKDPNCSMESIKVLALLISLIGTIGLIVMAFSFFREDREEQITPLCPQLVVKDSELKFRMPALALAAQADSTSNMDVTDNKENIVCKISMDWPDPFRGSPHGVAATVRIHKSEMTLATIVARNVAVLGQGLALCRTGCEIFGFVEPEGNKFLVRHRTGVHLLTLVGSFEHWDIEGVNPVGSKVCSMKRVGDECVGKVSQHVDAGLVLCALMATYVHRRLSQPWGASSGQIPRPLTVQGTGAPDPRIQAIAASTTAAAVASAEGTAKGATADAVEVPSGSGEAAEAADTVLPSSMNADLLQVGDISQFRSPPASSRGVPQTPEEPAAPTSSVPEAGTGG
jgi:hypothetical protein